MIISKFFISLHQLQIAKQLNGEPPLPIDLNKFFTPSTATQPQTRNTDLEAQGYARQPQYQTQQFKQPQPQPSPVPPRNQEDFSRNKLRFKQQDDEEETKANTVDSL